jgi:precorrin-6B methylase 2
VELTHKFDVSQKVKLDNPARRAILPPDETLGKLGLNAGEVMADIGCGIGYFTFPAAKMIGPGGRVYALDVAPEKDLTKVLEVEGFINIETLSLGTEFYAVKAQKGFN